MYSVRRKKIFKNEQDNYHKMLHMRIFSHHNYKNNFSEVEDKERGFN